MRNNARPWVVDKFTITILTINVDSVTFIISDRSFWLNINKKGGKHEEKGSYYRLW